MQYNNVAGQKSIFSIHKIWSYCNKLLLLLNKFKSPFIIYQFTFLDPHTRETKIEGVAKILFSMTDTDKKNYFGYGGDFREP